MGFRNIRHAFEMQAARGNLREEHIPLMEAVTISEMAADAFGRAFYGPVWSKAKRDVEARRLAQDAASGVDASIRKWEALAKDVQNLPSTLARETIITTLDLPAVLGRARDVVIQEAEEPVDTASPLLAASAKATRENFLPRATLKQDLDLMGLFKQPEGTNVRYEGFEWSEDEYVVDKYSRAIGWTWEARVNDDLAGFLQQASALGFAARLNRVRILFAAIVAGTTRTTPTGTGAGAGGPTIENVAFARAELADTAPPRRLGAISIPVPWEGLAQATRDNQFIPASTPAELNPVYQTFSIGVEEIMPEVLADAVSGNALDWLAHDAAIPTWLEFATLRGFEGGPRIAFKLPDVRDTNELGSFDNMTDAMKVVDVIGAKVTDASRVIRIAGA